MCVGIKIQNLRKVIEGNIIINNVSLDVKPGMIVSIFGPNGTGKTTLLNILSGIDTQYEGDIHKTSPEKINASYLFQNYRDSLFHWRTGWRNIALPLEMRGKNDNAHIRKLIMKFSNKLHLKVDLDKYPYECSGGQQQIIAFMRALITRPNLLLIDEPFSALDYENNLFLRECLIRYYDKYRPTVIIVTHNIEEVVHLSHEIVVLSQRPASIHEVIKNEEPHPRSLDFISSPYFNDLKDKVLSSFRKVARL